MSKSRMKESIFFDSSKKTSQDDTLSDERRKIRGSTTKNTSYDPFKLQKGPRNYRARKILVDGTDQIRNNFIRETEKSKQQQQC